MTNVKESCIIIDGLPGYVTYLRRQPPLTTSPRLVHLPFECNPMNRKTPLSRIFGLPLGLVLLFANSMEGQNALDRERAMVDSSGDRWWYTLIFIGAALMIGAFILWRRNKSGSGEKPHEFESRYQGAGKAGEGDFDGVDAEKELEWYRKAKRTVPKSDDSPDLSPLAAAGRTRRGRDRVRLASPVAENGANLQAETKAFQEKMKRLQFSQLPINSFLQLTEARSFEELPMSSDPALISAIEQVNEEFEEDEVVRELALRILAAFRMRNSVEALSQIALYDLSSNIRSKAVATLTDFDHESVFEVILLACADPTREVRAAAARGLFRLSFDRAEAWKRLIATRDDFRMSQAARAAVESGIVVKSFDRLLHEDMRIAYEAFALVGMLLRSGETAQIFEAIENHQDERVKFALLHVIKIVRDERAAKTLTEMIRGGNISGEVAERAAEVITSIDTVTA